MQLRVSSNLQTQTGPTGLLQNVGASDPLEIVTEGLRRILDALDGLKIKSKLKPNSFLFAFGLKAN